MSTPDSLTYLKSLGFKTFSDTGFIDESYDSERDDEARYYMILTQIYNLTQLLPEQKDSFLYNSKQIIEHNYNHLKNFDVENFENKFKNHFYKLNHQNIKTLL